MDPERHYSFKQSYQTLASLQGDDHCIYFQEMMMIYPESMYQQPDFMDVLLRVIQCQTTMQNKRLFADYGLEARIHHGHIWTKSWVTICLQIKHDIAWITRLHTQDPLLAFGCYLHLPFSNRPSFLSEYDGFLTVVAADRNIRFSYGREMTEKEQKLYALYELMGNGVFMESYQIDLLSNEIPLLL